MVTVRHKKRQSFYIVFFIQLFLHRLYFTQPRALFNLMNSEQKQALFNNTAAAMGDAPHFIKYRHIRNCHWCDPAYGEGVANALGLTVEDALKAREVDPALGQPGLL